MFAVFLQASSCEAHEYSWEPASHQYACCERNKGPWQHTREDSGTVMVTTHTNRFEIWPTPSQQVNSIFLKENSGWHCMKSVFTLQYNACFQVKLSWVNIQTFSCKLNISLIRKILPVWRLVTVKNVKIELGSLFYYFFLYLSEGPFMLFSNSADEVIPYSLLLTPLRWHTRWKVDLTLS